MTDRIVSDTLRHYAARSLVIGGTADPLWSTPVDSPEDQRVLELAGVDHAHHRPGDWRTSIDVIQDVLTAVEDFSAALAAS